MNFTVSHFPVIEHLCHQPHLIFLLVMILGVAGFVSGLLGFGLAMVGVPVLWILPPREGIPLLMLLSACSQIFSIGQLRSSMTPLREWWPKGPAPCILAGWLGVPVGLWLLAHLNASLICSIIGLLIVACSFWNILKPTGRNFWKRTLSGSLGAGFLGGMIGGFCGSPSFVMLIWANLLGLKKEEQRATVQPFILAMQLLALLLFVIRGGVFSGCFGILWATSLTVVLISTRLGVMAFRGLSDPVFQRAVFLLLSLSGVAMIAKGAGGFGEVLSKLDHLLISL